MALPKGAQYAETRLLARSFGICTLHDGIVWPGIRQYRMRGDERRHFG